MWDGVKCHAMCDVVENGLCRKGGWKILKGRRCGWQSMKRIDLKHQQCLNIDGSGGCGCEDTIQHLGPDLLWL